MTYPPSDDRLKHLIAQQLNPNVDSWQLAFWIASNIVNSPEVRVEIDRIGAAHAANEPCGDRHCGRCFQAQLDTGVAR
jgi:hypothetical protein